MKLRNSVQFSLVYATLLDIGFVWSAPMLIAACMLDFHVFIAHNIVDVGYKHCLNMFNAE